MQKHLAEKLAIATMALGILMVCQPLFPWGFRYGFLIILLGIAAFTLATHLPSRNQ